MITNNVPGLLLLMIFIGTALAGGLQDEGHTEFEWNELLVNVTELVNKNYSMNITSCQPRVLQQQKQPANSAPGCLITQSTQGFLALTSAMIGFGGNIAYENPRIGSIAKFIALHKPLFFMATLMILFDFWWLKITLFLVVGSIVGIVWLVKAGRRKYYEYEWQRNKTTF